MAQLSNNVTTVTGPVRYKNGQFAPSRPLLISLSYDSPPEAELAESLDRVGLIRGIDYEFVVEVETEQQWLARNEGG